MDSSEKYCDTYGEFENNGYQYGEFGNIDIDFNKVDFGKYCY